MLNLARACPIVLGGCLALSSCGGSAQTVSSRASIPGQPVARGSGDQAVSPCGSPKTRKGQPEVVVILLDGVGSEAAGGTYYPLPVSNALGRVPIVRSYCPLDGSYAERMAPEVPPGLETSLRRWSEFRTPGGSSGSGTDTSQACDRADSGGFGRGSCLTEELANAGAVLAPYSYTGAELSRDGRFTAHAYSADDSKQPLCSSVKALAREIASLHSGWRRAGIVIAGHSYGGLVAETWWYDVHAGNGGHCVPPTGLGPIRHVFSLDSPINGVRACARAGAYADAASATWCDLWGYSDNVHGVKNGQQIAAVDDPELSFTAVGTPNDPTYGNGPRKGGGGLQAQLVYHCYDDADENDGHASCIDRTGGQLPVSFPSLDAQCDGGSGDIHGTTGHDIVKTCPAVIHMIVAAVTAAANTQSTSLVGVFGAATPGGGHQVDVMVTDAKHPRGDPTAAGIVTVLYDGQQQVGSGPVVHGRARIITTAGDPGQGSVSAAYSGDTTHAQSSVCLYGAGSGSCAYGPSAGPSAPGCPGTACGSANGVTVIITSVRRSPRNNYGEDLTSKGQFFVRMGVRVKNNGARAIAINNAHFALADSDHIINSTSDEGYESKCGLSGNGDPGLTLANGADITMPESLCFEPRGSLNSGFTVALGLDGGGEVDVPVH